MRAIAIACSDSIAAEYFRASQPATRAGDVRARGRRIGCAVVAEAASLVPAYNLGAECAARRTQKRHDTEKKQQAEDNGGDQHDRAFVGFQHLLHAGLAELHVAQLLGIELRQSSAA